MDTQTIIVIVVVAAALAYVGRRLWRSLHGQEDGACEKCEPGTGKHGK